MKYTTFLIFVFQWMAATSQIFQHDLHVHGDNLEVAYNPIRFRTSILNYPETENVLKYEKLEIGVELPYPLRTRVANFTEKLCGDSCEKVNPYLEWELKVEAIFIHEGDTLNPIIIDGFFTKTYDSYMQPVLPKAASGQAYTDEEYQQLGGWEETWTRWPFRVRFAPPQTGRWTWQIRIITPEETLTSQEMGFRVTESENKGYMQAGKNGRFLEAGGHSFYPAGVNACWPETYREFDSELYAKHTYTDRGTTFYRPEMYREALCVPRVYEKYKEVLCQLNDQGVNYVRTIMNPVSTEIEWENLGDYTARLNMAQEMDAILELAESRNMYLHWDLAIHYTFKHNVYHIAQWDWIDDDGTPSYAYKKTFNLDHPTEFFTHPEAKKYYKQRLRYILSRWGYSTHIAVFELMSEISNIGSKVDDGNAHYQENYPLYAAWQEEMGNYLKSLYNGQNHLLTCSYSGEKHPNDDTYKANGPYAVMTSNIYDFGAPDFAGFFIRHISGKFLNESADSKENIYTKDCNTAGQHCKWNIKPLMFAETEPIEAMGNTRNRCNVELNRSLWQSAFSGLAVSLSWSAWYHTDNYEIFGQISRFMQNTDLDREGWHPGASQFVISDSLKLWEFNANYAASMDGKEKKADLSYLRSGDQLQAIGVVTNKTYNVYNSLTEPGVPDPQHAALKIRQSVSPADEKLEIKGLKKGRYQVEYFMPGNQEEPIYTSYQKGRSVAIDLPYIAPTRDGYIVLFRVKKVE